MRGKGKRITLTVDEHSTLSSTLSAMCGVSPANIKVSRFGVFNKSIELCNTLLECYSFCHDNPSYVLAFWTGSGGEVAKSAFSRDGMHLGRINQLFKITVSIKTGRLETIREDHFFAQVDWCEVHPQRFKYGGGAEVWSPSFQPRGPSSYLPVQRVFERCAYSLETIASSDPILKKENVLLAVPLPSKAVL